MWRKLAKITTALCLGTALIMGGTGAASAATTTAQAPTMKVIALACNSDSVCLNKAERALQAEQVISPKIYVVRNGDYLSTIASKEHTDTESLYCVNRKVIGGDPNIIHTGQKLTVPTSRIKCSISLSTSAGTASPLFHGYGGSGALARFQSCVIARESGGNPYVMNSSGHYGLYQFSLSTWEAYGGASSEFGHASAAYQTQIFYNAMANPYSGEMNWEPYDGCVYG